MIVYFPRTLPQHLPAACTPVKHVRLDRAVAAVAGTQLAVRHIK